LNFISYETPPDYFVLRYEFILEPSFETVMRILGRDSIADLFSPYNAISPGNLPRMLNTFRKSLSEDLCFSEEKIRKLICRWKLAGFLLCENKKKMQSDNPQNCTPSS